MKETKVYVDELPEICDECPLGYFYDCQYCFLRPDLAEKHEWCEKDKHCPLIDIKDHDRELVKEVCEKIKLKFSDTRSHNWGIEQIELYDILDQIQKEAENE